MKLYGRKTSFNVQKVLWLLDELGLGYEHTELGGRFGGLDSEAFARLNPLRKVPVLQDGDRSVWESHTILRYLAASHGGQSWYPQNAYKRSLYERWLDWSQCIFQPVFMRVFWGYYRTPPERRDMFTVNKNLQNCRDCLEIINQQLAERNFLSETSISLADIPTGAVLYRLTEQGLEVRLPTNVARWYQTLRQRPGYRKWIMSDFSELKGREDF